MLLLDSPALPNVAFILEPVMRSLCSNPCRHNMEQNLRSTILKVGQRLKQTVRKEGGNNKSGSGAGALLYSAAFNNITHKRCRILWGLLLKVGEERMKNVKSQRGNTCYCNQHE